MRTHLSCVCVCVRRCGGSSRTKTLERDARTRSNLVFCPVGARGRRLRRIRIRNQPATASNKKTCLGQIFRVDAFSAPAIVSGRTEQTSRVLQSAKRLANKCSNKKNRPNQSNGLLIFVLHYDYRNIMVKKQSTKKIISEL